MVWLYSKLANPVLKGGILQKGKGGEGGGVSTQWAWYENLSLFLQLRKKNQQPLEAGIKSSVPFLLPRQPSHVAFLVIFRVHSLLPFLALRSLGLGFFRMSNCPASYHAPTLAAATTVVLRWAIRK
jgi:hypothetical protein